LCRLGRLRVSDVCGYGSRNPPARVHLLEGRTCRRSGRCTSGEGGGLAAGWRPPGYRQIAQARRTDGGGTFTSGHTKLNIRWPFKTGTYKLTLKERPAASQQIGAEPVRAIETIVPIAIG